MAGYQTIKFRLEGVAPMLMHNGQTADPLNRFAKAMKELTAKRSKKTDADIEKLTRIEWEAGLYLDGNGRPCIPGENIEAMIIAAAKRDRLGVSAKSGIICPDAGVVEYDGPKDLDKMYDSGKFTDKRGVRVTTNRIVRCRPRFDTWSMNVSLLYLDDVLNRSQVVTMMSVAGIYIGLGDFRPRFGRFDAEVVA